MTAPGVQINVRVAMPAIAAPTDTATLFAIGVTTSGPSEPRYITSIDDFVRVYGARIGSSPYLYDCLDLNFKEGLGGVWVARTIAAAAVLASLTLKDTGAVNVLTVKAAGAGIWGNNLSVQVIAGISAGSKVLVVTLSSVEVERSPDVQNANEALAWINSSSLYLGSAAALGTPSNQLATAAAAPLTSGADGTIADSDHVAALTRFTPDLGPGQVAAPGLTSSTVQLAVQAHAHFQGGATNGILRFGIIDLADAANSSTLVAGAAALAGADAPYAAYYSGWHYVQGVTGQAPRIVPSSCIMPGIIARNDQAKGPGQSPMGQWGVSQTSQGLTNPFTLQSDFDALNAGQVIAWRQMLGGVRAYDLCTGANPSSQSQLTQIGQVRVLMALRAGLSSAAEQYVGGEVDGAGHFLNDYQTALAAVARPFFDSGQIYGELFSDACVVNVGPSINPPSQLAAGKLRAVVGVRISPNTPRVVIDLVKTAITDTLGAAA